MGKSIESLCDPMVTARYWDDFHVFRLVDLDDWAFDGVSLAVLGMPINHSLSPQMHNAALRSLAEKDSSFSRWRYFRFEVSPEDLRVGLQKFAQAGFLGLNLTIPHKVQALECVAEVDPQYRLLGAVNTLKLSGGNYIGYNTDGYGIQQAVKQELGVSLSERPVLLCGAGGAARAIAVQCLLEGCPELWIGNRSQERLGSLMDILHPLDDSRVIRGFDLADLPHDLPRRAIVINATSLGLRREDPAPMDLSSFSPDTVVYDTTYGLHDSQLYAMAQDMGMRAANGLSMLVWQGAKSLEIWSGAKPSASVMRQRAQEVLSSNHA